jgi:hypothetical protein
MLAAGWIAFPKLLYRTETQPLRFSHKTHTGDKVGYKCGDCHTIGQDGRFSGIPKVASCAACHAAPLSTTAEEKLLIERYVTPNVEIPWLVYSRQPENVHFSHATHVNKGKLTCEQCHGKHGSSDQLRPYQENRISGYSRDIWGHSIARINLTTPQHPSMKMDDCTNCHAQHAVEASCMSCHK